MIVATARIFPQTRTELERFGAVAHPEGAEPWDTGRLQTELSGATAWMAFMTDRVDAAVLDAAPKLRILACALKGYDNIDVDACQARGVQIAIVPDLLTAPTAELAIGLTIGLGRHINAGDAAVRSGRFEGWRPILYGQGLEGAVVALLGLGRLGSAVATRLAPFGCVLRGVDAAGGPEGLASLPLAAALAGADIVINALPLTPATRHMVDAAALSLLPPHALLVNIGRGSTVDEDAVAAALHSGRLGGYAADVFAFEDWALAERPRAIPPALLTHPATLFTPHLGSATRAARLAIELRAAANIADVLAGGEARDRIG